jgi:eukaryotic-like serine/threonine-protein kinase
MRPDRSGIGAPHRVSVDENDWRTLSRLLDEALDLPGTERLTWIEHLGDQYAGLKANLRELLANQALLETADFLGEAVAFGEMDSMRREAAKSAGLSTGSVVGSYRLTRELGRGGMGTVWLADRSDGLIKRSVALKLPHPALYDQHLAERFGRERDILAGLAHPNIARLYDAGVAENGQPYLALEYVEGSPLTVYCDVAQASVRDRILLFLQVLGAVQYAHAHLVIHRDLKPSNILVGADGHVKLLDFGIAKLVNDGEGKESKLTQLSGRALTPDYASPEQIAGASISTASDVYSLGVVLYELLAGTRPYEVKRESRGAIEEAILAAEPIKPSQAANGESEACARATTRRKLAKSLRGDLDVIVLKSLKKAPQQRYATADAFTLDLQRYLRGEPVEARPDGALYKLGKFAARNKIGIAAAGVAALGLAAGTVVSVWQARSARVQAAAARREADKANAVQDFLVNVFSANSHLQADPVKARQTTARDLLDRGAVQIGASLKSDPEAKEAVLATLGDMYAQMGLDAQASVINLQRIEVLKQAYGPNDARVAEGIFQYTRDIASTNERAKIIPALNQAQAILDTNRDYTSRTRAALWLEYAHYYRYSAPDRMRLYADRAVNLLADRYRHEWILVLAMKEAARARFELGEYTASEAQFQETLTATHKIEPGPSAWEIAPLAQMAGAQAELLKFDDAERNFRTSWALSRKLNGESHNETLQSESRLGAFLHITSRPVEGRLLLANALTEIERDPSKKQNSIAAVVYGLYGQALAADGKLEAADTLFAREMDFVRPLYPQSTLLARALLHRGVLDTALGRFDAAQSALDEGAGMWRNITGTAAEPALYNPFMLARAQLRLARADPEGAIAALSERLPPAGLGPLPRAVDDISARIIGAQAELSLEHAAIAVSDAREALDMIVRLPLRERYEALEANAALTLGRALERSGDFAQALPNLERALRLREDNAEPGSPWVGEAEVALANCLLDLGGRNRARSLLDKAAAAFASHAELGAQFKVAVGTLAQRFTRAR